TKSSKWWREIIGNIPTEMTTRFTWGSSLTASGVQRPKEVFNATLLSHLLLAMQQLKEGRRPNHALLFKIKFMLFCSPLSPPRFQQASFDPWRADCTELSWWDK